jgi:DNA-directed RNA polymerase
MGVQAIMFKKRTREYAPNTAANGISPNFVHSLDSAHLCLTINAYQGDILPIHDSFGTHPCDVPELHRAIRETFIQMYSKDVFKELFEYNGLPTDNLPQYGKLDLNVVLESEFMFC